MDTIFRDYQPTHSSDRSAGDRLRHRQKVRESIRENIADIISEESIIGKSKDKIIKVPLRGVKEYRFVFGDNTPSAGTGDGESQPGQVIGKVGTGQGQPGDAAGDKPGVDYYETDVTLEELINIMFEDLELPDMERKALREVAAETTKRKGYRKVGIRVRLDKKRSAKERVKRMKATQRHDAEEEPQFCEQCGLQKTDHDGSEDHQFVDDKLTAAAPTAEEPKRFPFHVKDLRYKHREEDIEEESNAVLFCIMDTSGSMDTLKKYLARSFFFLLYQFVKSRYRNVEVVFIGHTTDAREQTEDEFFHKGESGGTFCSSGYVKALEIIAARYHPTLWNIYAFHCSDGDNFESDNAATVKAASELADVSQLLGYGEIKPLGPRYYEGSLLQLFKRIDKPNFHTILIEKKEDIWPSFKAFLSKERDQKKAS